MSSVDDVTVDCRRRYKNTSSGSATSWNLDALGNWTGGSQSRTFNAQNQITGITGTGLVTPTYDSNGNTTLR